MARLIFISTIGLILMVDNKIVEHVEANVRYTDKEPVESSSIKYRSIISNNPPKLIPNLGELGLKWDQKPDEALKEIDSLIERFKDTKFELDGPSLELYERKTYAYMDLNRKIEALIEAKNCERLCEKIPGCVLDAVKTRLVAWVKNSIKDGGHYAVLGVKKGANPAEIKKAYRRLTLLLHPDKNINLDKASQDYRQQLLVVVQDSYKALTNNNV